MTLTPQAVHSLFSRCLFEESELPPKEFVEAHGIQTKVGFHPSRLQEAKSEVVALLAELPKEFREGWSFLNACNDKDGNLWTGDHRTVEELVLLGLATGNVQLCLPREFWSALPGGVPYYRVIP